MPTPQHDIPFTAHHSPKPAEVFRLREEIDRLVATGRQACRRDPTLAPQIRPLLLRLEEIRRELDRAPERSWPQLAGELYPFLVQRALSREPYTP